MARDQNDTSSAQREDLVARPYLLAIWWTTVVWLAVVAAIFCRSLLVTASHGNANLGETLIIAIASLLIAYASMSPSLLGHWSVTRRARSRRSVGEQKEAEAGQTEQQQRQTGLLVAGVTIRLIGTVALFLTCRYQMATPTELLAGMTISWYVLLTFVDVLVLARELPKPTVGTTGSTCSQRSEPRTPIKV